MTLSTVARVCAALLLLGACSGPTPVPTPGPATPEASATPPPGTAVPTPAPSATWIQPGSPVTLTLWTTPEFAPSADTRAGALLTVQLGTFQKTHPNVRFDVVRKKAHGAGGVLDFLLSAAPVVPGILPDLVALDAGELPQAVDAGLLLPLESLVATDLSADLYPFARTLGTTRGHLYGIPFGADTLHLVYNHDEQEEPPLSWQDVLSHTGRLAFAAGTDQADAVLADYLAAGGRTVDGAGQARLDIEPLAAVLRYYREAQARGRYVDTIAQIETPADAWDLYRAGKATETLATASLYLAQRESVRATEVGAQPGPNGPAGSIARAWVWAVPRRLGDPVRQQLAAELLAWLMAPENLGPWTFDANLLPARRAALTHWPGQDPYVDFLKPYLETVVPQPPAAVDARLAPALHKALQAVLANGVTPEVAAAAAAADVHP